MTDRENTGWRAGSRPFKVVQEAAYYDGPVAGIIECARSGRRFQFDMLDWDSQQDIRVFGLVEVDQRATEHGGQLRGGADDAQNRPTGSQAAEEQQRSPVTTRPNLAWIVAWHNGNLEVVSAKDLSGLGYPLPEKPFFERAEEVEDWFAVAGIPRT